MIQAMNPKKMKHEKIIDNFFQQNVKSSQTDVSSLELIES